MTFAGTSKLSFTTCQLCEQPPRLCMHCMQYASKLHTHAGFIESDNREPNAVMAETSNVLRRKPRMYTLSYGGTIVATEPEVRVKHQTPLSSLQNDVKARPNQQKTPAIHQNSSLHPSSRVRSPDPIPDLLHCRPSPRITAITPGPHVETTLLDRPTIRPSHTHHSRATSYLKPGTVIAHPSPTRPMEWDLRPSQALPTSVSPSKPLRPLPHHGQPALVSPRPHQGPLSRPSRPVCQLPPSPFPTYTAQPLPGKLTKPTRPQHGAQPGNQTTMPAAAHPPSTHRPSASAPASPSQSPQPIHPPTSPARPPITQVASAPPQLPTLSTAQTTGPQAQSAVSTITAAAPATAATNTTEPNKRNGRLAALKQAYAETQKTAAGRIITQVGAKTAFSAVSQVIGVEVGGLVDSTARLSDLGRGDALSAIDVGGLVGGAVQQGMDGCFEEVLGRTGAGVEGNGLQHQQQQIQQGQQVGATGSDDGGGAGLWKKRVMAKGAGRALGGLSLGLGVRA